MKRLKCLVNQHTLQKIGAYHGFCLYQGGQGFQLIEKYLCEHCKGTFEYAIIGESRDGLYQQKVACVGLPHMTELENE